MAVDVQSEVTIARPPAEVAAFSAAPDNAPAWCASIRAVRWKTPRPLRIGSIVAFEAQFLGRRLVYSYEVAEYVPGRRLVMRTAEGPFPMETTYTWEPAAGASTRMTLRNRGEAAGFARLLRPFVAWAIRRANRRDLAQLKRLLERPFG